jgi:transposase
VQVLARFCEMKWDVVDWAMRSPVYVRPLTDAEVTALQHGLRAVDSFTVRRCQILLASARAERAPDIAHALSCGDQTVRNAIREFNAEGLASLQRESSRPKTVVPLFDQARAEQLRALLHRSPRDFGHPTSVWTLHLAAQTCASEGITPYRVSIETIRQALALLDISWRRAKHWITSPDPAYAKKNTAATG